MSITYASLIREVEEERGKPMHELGPASGWESLPLSFTLSLDFTSSHPLNPIASRWQFSVLSLPLFLPSTLPSAFSFLS